MRQSVLDDLTLIGARRKVIAAEERRAVLEACDCPSAIDPANGRAVQQHVYPCRHCPAPDEVMAALHPACMTAPAIRIESWSIGVRRETLRDRLAELGLIAGERK